MKEMSVRRMSPLVAQLLMMYQIVTTVDSYSRDQHQFPEDNDWSYTGSLSQHNWGRRYPSCNSARQSPIDIDLTFAQVQLRFQDLRLEGWEHLTAFTSTITNDGKTVVLGNLGEFYVSGGGLSSRFRVGRVIFHWGRCNGTSDGSEHSLNGRKFPLEMQIYCYNPKQFQSVEEAMKEGGRITALAVLFETSVEDNHNFNTLIEGVNTVSRFGKSAPVDRFSLRSLLPNCTEKFYIYNGSLTSPPCSETVEWIVFQHTTAISETQLEVFCEVMTMEKAGYVMLTDYLQNNYREQQQQFTGQVFSSYTGTEEVLTPTCSSQPENVQADAQNDTTIVVTWERPRAVYDTSIDWYSVTYQRLQGQDQPKLQYRYPGDGYLGNQHTQQQYRTDGDQDVAAIIPSLLANSSYVVQVVAVCTNGLTGRPSDQIIVDMPLEEPGPDDDTDQTNQEQTYWVQDQVDQNQDQDQNQVDLGRPVDEIPAELTRVYQNQQNQNILVQTARPLSETTTPTQSRDSRNRPDQTQANQNPDWSSKAVDQTRTKQDQNRRKAERAGAGQNYITDQEQRVPWGRTNTGSAADSRGSIWVTVATDQPGFLFPVSLTTNTLAEETSLAVTSQSDVLQPGGELYTPPTEDLEMVDVFNKGVGGSSESIESVNKPTQEDIEQQVNSLSNSDDRGAKTTPPFIPRFLVRTTPPSSLLSSTSSLVTPLQYTTQPPNNAEGSNSSHESRVGLGMVGIGLEEIMREEREERENRSVVPLVLVSTTTILCLLLLVAILIYWRNCFHTPALYSEDNNNTTPKIISTPSTPLLGTSEQGEDSMTVKQFVKHVAELHSTNSFYREFQEVQVCTVDLDLTTDSSNHPGNRSKNRYINILAYDHSRVKLNCSEDNEQQTDYINANYIDGYRRPAAYIATQGPLQSGRGDFWKMVWTNNVGVIVMITNLLEQGRRKCEQYWPEEEEGEEEYGQYLVKTKGSKILAYHTVRTFILRETGNKKAERTVVQFHYTRWPDMGVPDSPLPLLSFIHYSSRAQTSSNGPLLVHCSAGVGRTGAYIVVDSMLQQIQDQGTVDVLAFLKHARTQRNHLVQTQDQYVFIHDVLVEAILSRDTLVTSNLIHRYASDLLTPRPSGRTRMDLQFKMVSQSRARQCDYSSALRDGNKNKNRSSSLMPVERSRVCLSSSGDNSSDYINASYITGYTQCQEFIITQHPLRDTVQDFWRMVWEQRAQFLLDLPDTQTLSEGEEPYWPSAEQSISCEGFSVSLSGEEQVLLTNQERVRVQQFLLEDSENGVDLEVRRFGAPCWPNPDGPIRSSLELVRVVDGARGQGNGPLVVLDRLGGSVCGLYCALSTVLEQLEKESCVDVYQTARLINLERPGLFNDLEQFVFLYRAVLSEVGGREDQEVLKSTFTNGSVTMGTAVTESLESLM